MERSLLSFFFLFLFPASTLWAQLSLPAFNAELGGIVHTEKQKAFWMLSNNNGRYHPQGNTAFVSVELFSDSSRFHTFGGLPSPDSAQLFHFDYGLHAFYNGSRPV